MKVKCRICVTENSKHITGDGRIKLLEAIDSTGSVNLASKEFGLSYPHAWRYIHELEEAFGKKMVNTKIGGKGGGGLAGHLLPDAEVPVEEVLHEPRHVAEVVGRAEGDGVAVDEVRGRRVVDPLHLRRGPFHALSASGDRIRHRLMRSPLV